MPAIKYAFSNASTRDAAPHGIYYFYNHGSYPEMHTHTFWEITVITAGEVMHSINGEKKRLTKNALLLIRPSDEHALLSVPGKTHSHVNVVVNRQLMETQLHFFGDAFYRKICDMHDCLFYVSDHVVVKALDAITHMQMMDKDDPQYLMRLKLLFFDLLREIFANEIKQSDNTKQQRYPAVLQEILDKMYDKANFSKSIEELCAEANYSHTHIIRLFKQYTDTTPVKLFNTIKLNHARNLLESTDQPVIFIANEICYSLAAFNVAFKELFRYTPSQYRKHYTAHLEV